MANKVRFNDQKIIEAKSGEPCLFEIQATNPYERR